MLEAAFPTICIKKNLHIFVPAGFFMLYCDIYVLLEIVMSRNSYNDMNAYGPVNQGYLPNYGRNAYRQAAPQGYRPPGAPYYLNLNNNASSSSQPRISAAPYSINSGANYPAEAEPTTPKASKKASSKAANKEIKARQSQPANSSTRKLRTNRGLIKYLLLCLVTFGLYQFWFFSRFAKDLNVACSHDGKHTRGIIAFFLLTFITFGIYALIWILSLVSRVNHGAHFYRKPSKISVGSYLFWMFFGIYLGTLGYYIAMYKLFKTMNNVCEGYNETLEQETY